MYNFHNHTYRCGHATGKDEEYVLEAIKNGYEVMGFSDHAPYLFPKGHHSGYRIQLDKAQDYANSIKALKEKYKSVIDIKLGYELEYFPALWDEEIEYLKGFEYDYLILGQHYTDNEYEPFAHYSGHETDSVAVLDKYISQVTLGAKTGSDQVSPSSVENDKSELTLFELLLVISISSSPFPASLLTHSTSHICDFSSIFLCAEKYGTGFVQFILPLSSKVKKVL